MRRFSAISLVVMALTACVDTKPSPSSESSMSSSSSTTDSLPEASIKGPLDTVLLVALDLPPGQLVVDVRYVLHNQGSGPLIVFDRGTVHDISIGRQPLGGIGVPRQEISGDDVTLVNAAMALPQPSPTSPPTPLGIELAAGATLAGRFQVMLHGPSLPKRLRWCVGVMPMDGNLLNSPQQTKDGKMWTASFATAERQQRVCTPWYDVAGARFDEA
jgi:hypothetical protein